MSANYVINIESGVVMHRNPATNANSFIFRLIDDETARAVADKEITAAAVIEAITKADHSKEGFSWKEYDDRRRAAIKQLNMSERNMIPVNGDEANKNAGEDEKVEEVTTLADIKPQKAAKVKAEKVEKVEKVAEPKKAAKVELPQPSGIEALNL